MGRHVYVRTALSLSTLQVLACVVSAGPLGGGPVVKRSCDQHSKFHISCDALKGL